MKRARFAAFLLVTACGSTEHAGTDATDPGHDSSTADSPTVACPRDPAAADRARHVVIAHPYDGKGDAANVFEVLDLATDGTLTRPTAHRTFTMGRATFGTMAFTPDGKIGVAAQDDGTIGVFSLADDGTPTVVDPAFKSTFYAERIVPDPAGDGVFIVDGNTRENGGGIYRVDLACDGTPSNRGLVAAGSTPGAFAFVDTTHAVAAGGAVLDSATGDDVDLLAWGATPSRLGGADAFGHDDEIIGGSALTGDGQFFLVGDTSQFSGFDDSVAVVSVSSTAVAPVAVLTPIDDPEGMAVAPTGHTGIVTSAFGNKIFVIDDNAGAGWRIRGEVAYAGGAKPQLPGDVVSIRVGSLAGHAFVSENTGIRQVAIGDDGTVTDAGSLVFGDGLDEILGAIGVQP